MFRRMFMYGSIDTGDHATTLFRINAFRETTPATVPEPVLSQSPTYRQLGRAGRYNRSRMWLALLMFLVQPATGQTIATESPDLVAQPVVSQAKYCKESSGDITLRLEFILHFKNTTPNPIVLPLFARLSRYELFSDDAALTRGQKERAVRFRAEDVLDPNKLDETGPDPKLFRILKPGETASLYTSVFIVVLPAGAAKSPMLGRDHYLKLHMNPWPAARGVGKTLSRVWAQYGNLLLTDIPSLPFKFHIQHQPRCEVCAIRVD